MIEDTTVKLRNILYGLLLIISITGEIRREYVHRINQLISNKGLNYEL